MDRRILIFIAALAIILFATKLLSIKSDWAVAGFVLVVGAVVFLTFKITNK